MTTAVILVVQHRSLVIIPETSLFLKFADLRF